MVDILDFILKLLGGIGTIVALIALTLRLIRRRQGPTWGDALRKAREILDKINQEPSNWEPTVVIGIGRSGGILGGWLAGNLGGKPFIVVNDCYSQQSSKDIKVEFPGGKQVLSALKEFKKSEKNGILLVKGAASRGQTFTTFKETFSDQLDSWDIKRAVLYKNPAASVHIDFVGKFLEPWPKRFPWHDKRGKWPRWLKNNSNNKTWL